MDFLMWLLGSVLMFMGLYLTLFPAKFLHYDSKSLPNFWDLFGSGFVLTNWKSRRRITRVMGIIFVIASLLIFWSIYNIYYASIA